MNKFEANFKRIFSKLSGGIWFGILFYPLYMIGLGPVDALICILPLSAVGVFYRLILIFLEAEIKTENFFFKILIKIVALAIVGFIWGQVAVVLRSGVMYGALLYGSLMGWPGIVMAGMVIVAVIIFFAIIKESIRIEQSRFYTVFLRIKNFGLIIEEIPEKKE